MKAIALISGGLDSILAARVIKGQGIDVQGVHFRTPFCLRDKDKGMADLARRLAEEAGIPLRVVDLKEEFLEIVRHPRHGYGSNINPCIDCRVLMLRLAKRIMEEEGASFLVSGEVVAQRDMSQHRPVMSRVEREAEVEGIILRPLSAKLLAETVPEKNGWVDRQKLFAFNGRSRRPQIDLAVMLGMLDFPNAAGGCLLTDPRFTERAKDLMKHGTFDMDNVELLRVGRHFRLSDDAKLVVGRNAEENDRIEALAREGDLLVLPPGDVSGPSALIRGIFSGELVSLALSIACRYSDRGERNSLAMMARKLPEKEWRVIEAAPIDDAAADKLHI
jgi:tRNA U34 2-thiouridine synthase MnmA/TrmU